MAKLRKRLKCKSPVRIEYDEKLRHGTVHMPDDSKGVDMDATIELFLNIDERVESIMTFAGSDIDAEFWLDAAEKTWIDTPRIEPRSGSSKVDRQVQLEREQQELLKGLSRS